MKKNKFKIWDKVSQEWYKPTYEGYKGIIHELNIQPCGEISLRTLNKEGKETTAHVSTFPNRYYPCQFTNCLGKGGVEFYEGDILKETLLGGSCHTFYIKRDLSEFRVYSIYHSGYKPPFLSEFLKESLDRVSIIGNIFSNPEELL